MSPDPEKFDLTSAERQAYRALRRDIPGSAEDEAQTLALLRKKGFFAASGASRHRPIATLAACAAGIVFAGALMARSHVRAPVATTPRDTAVATTGGAVRAAYLVWY